MSWLVDALVLLVLVAYAVGGHRQGFVLSLTSLVGLIGGSLLGMSLLPKVLKHFDVLPEAGLQRGAVLIIGVWVLGGLGQTLGRYLGMLARRRLRSNHGLDQVDRGMGAGLMFVAAAVVIWFIAAAVRPALPPDLARPMAESRSLQALDHLVPVSTSSLFAGFRDYLDESGFPRVFEGMGPEPITPVQAPDGALVDLPVAKQARRSIVKITGNGSRCSRDQEGTGWVLRDKTIVTNAHVVAGMDHVRVQVGGVGARLEGQVVLINASKDVAIVRVPKLEAPALPLGGRLDRGASAIVAGFPLDGPYRVDPARVRAIMDASGRDIRDERSVVREIYSLATTVQPGNSGGPLLDTKGRVVGVIFARSLDDVATGYALTLAEVDEELRAPTPSEPVSTGSCSVG